MLLLFYGVLFSKLIMQAEMISSFKLQDEDDYGGGTGGGGGPNSKFA